MKRMRIGLSWLRRWMLVVFLAMPLVGCGSMLSREDEIRLGEENAPKFLAASGGAVADAQLNAYVAQVGMKMVEQVPVDQRRGLPWEFYVADSSIINAFALPGGKIFITRGLMDRLSNEAELAAVLGHEVGHVVHEHIGKQMSQQAITQGLLSVVGSVTDTQWVDILGGTAGNLYLLKYGRGQELEADRAGLHYLAQAGYNPAGMLGVLLVLQKAGSGGRSIEMFSTHPHPETRIEQIRELIATEFAGTQDNPQYVLNEAQYQANAMQRLNKLPPPKHTGGE